MATARARPLPALAGRHTRRRLAGDVTATGGGAVRRRVRGGASGWLASGRVQSAVRPMARPEAETEIHLLKAREAPASPGTGARDAEKEAGGGGAQPGRLSQWRTAAFFLSLYLCLGLAFAFSFVIPCPVRPASRTAWSRAYDDAAAYAFLTAGDADGDRVQDVLVAFQAGAGSRNTSGAGHGSCSEGGFAPPCAFLAAHSGTNGTTLWERPVAQELLLMDCSVEHGGSPACLVIGNPASFVLLDLETGQTQWNETAIFGPNSTVLSPLLKIPDIDRDGVSDFLVFAVTGEETKSFFFSGTFGTQKKFSGSLHLPGLIGHFLHITKSGAHYILFYTAKALFAYSLKELYRMAVGPTSPALASLKEDADWEMVIPHKARQVPLASSGDIQYVTKISEKPGSHILVARSAMLELVNGQQLSSLWIVGVPHILRLQSWRAVLEPSNGKWSCFRKCRVPSQPLLQLLIADPFSSFGACTKMKEMKLDLGMEVSSNGCTFSIPPCPLSSWN